MCRKHGHDEVVLVYTVKIGSVKKQQKYSYNEYYMLRAIYDLARSLTIQLQWNKLYMRQALCRNEREEMIAVKVNLNIYKQACTAVEQQQ